MSPLQGILTGHEINKQVEAGNIRIDPFKAHRLNAASYDLTLGSEVAVYEAVVDGDLAPKSNQFTGRVGIAGEALAPRYESFRLRREFVAEPGVNCLDAKADNRVLRYEMDERGFLLKPGIGYLMHTAERVWTENFEPILDGKSSIGRLFIKVHETAGFGDPGFDGQYTLEVTTEHPVIVYPGMRFCQIRFHTLMGEIVPYHGNYTGDLACGPVASRAFRMFEKAEM